MQKNKCSGRPPGRKKTAKIEVSIEPKTKEIFFSILQQNGKCASVEICNWIDAFIKSSNTLEDPK